MPLSQSERRMRGAARGALFRALRDGKLVKPDKCGRCKAKDRYLQSHHDDWSKPLEVVWLCRQCAEFDRQAQVLRLRRRAATGDMSGVPLTVKARGRCRIEHPAPVAVCASCRKGRHGECLEVTRSCRCECRLLVLGERARRSREAAKINQSELLTS